MKQIKDVEIAKQAIDRMFENYEGSEAVDALNSVLSLIDSLAVEVPEAKPGAIDALFEIVGYAQDRMSGELKKQFERISGPARAELAQLQADQDKAIKEIERLVELNNKLQENEKRLIDEGYNKEKEIKNLKGALRTCYGFAY